MTANMMYELVNYILAKNLGQGNLNPNDFNNLATSSEYEYMDHLLGNFQYAGGKAVARVQFGMNQITRQRLTPFITALVPLTISVTGFAAYPADYEEGDAMYMANGNDKIRFVPQHKKSSYMKSVIDPVATNPIFLLQADGFQFYPITLGTAMLSYVQTPRGIVWGSLDDALGRPVYNPATSLDPLWKNTDMNEIIARVLRKCGVSLQNQDVNNYANQLQAEGQ